MESIPEKDPGYEGDDEGDKEVEAEEEAETETEKSIIGVGKCQQNPTGALINLAADTIKVTKLLR